MSLSSEVRKRIFTSRNNSAQAVMARVLAQGEKRVRPSGSDRFGFARVTEVQNDPTFIRRISVKGQIS